MLLSKALEKCMIFGVFFYFVHFCGFRDCVQLTTRIVPIDGIYIIYYNAHVSCFQSRLRSLYLS